MAFSNKTGRTTNHRKGRKARRSGKSNGLLRKLLLGSAIFLIPSLTLGVGGYLAYQQLNTETMDAAHCYERKDQYQVAAFVDFSLTHQISPSQRRDLVNALMQAYANLPPNGRMSIFTTANYTTASVSEPVFTLCNPAESDGEQARIGAPPTSATKLARQHREAAEEFAAFVDDLIAQSTNQSQLARSSPILEQIQGLSRYDFGVPLSKLILFTDGINNSANGQFCAKKGHLPRFSVFAGRPEYQFISPEDFHGADIDILLVEWAKLPQPNLPFCTNAELRSFWVDYFEANGAGQVRLTPLGYGAGK